MRKRNCGTLKSLSIFLVRRWNCGTAELQNKEYSVCGSRTSELKVTAYSLCGSETEELQVTEYSVFRSETFSHRICYVWNISGFLCNGPLDIGALGRRPLGQSHLGGAFIYCSILAVAATEIFVLFSPLLSSSNS